MYSQCEIYLGTKVPTKNEGAIDVITLYTALDFVAIRALQTRTSV